MLYRYPLGPREQIVLSNMLRICFCVQQCKRFQILIILFGLGMSLTLCLSRPPTFKCVHFCEGECFSNGSKPIAYSNRRSACFCVLQWKRFETWSILFGSDVSGYLHPHPQVCSFLWGDCCCNNSNLSTNTGKLLLLMTGFFLGKKGYLRCVFGISFLIYLALYMICQFEPFAVSRKAWGPKWVEFHYTFVSVENSFSVLHRLVVPLLLFGICSIVNQITWCGWKK